MMHRAYDRVKTAFRRLPSTYDLVTTRLSESEGPVAKELNQSQVVGTCMVMVYPSASTSASDSDNLVFTRS